VGEWRLSGNHHDHNHQQSVAVETMSKTAIIGLVFSAALLLSAGAMAQENNPADAAPPAASSNALGTVEHGNPAPVVHGNTTTVQQGNASIIFERAGTHNLDANNYAQWSAFADAHPEIARAIAYHPAVVNDPDYLRKHPALADFYQAHPEVHAALVANPGNFEAIPPRPGE